MKMFQFNQVRLYRFMIPKTGFVFFSKLSRFFTGSWQVWMRRRDKSWCKSLRSTSAPQRCNAVDTTKPMSSDEGMMIRNENRIPSATSAHFECIGNELY